MVGTYGSRSNAQVNKSRKNTNVNNYLKFKSGCVGIAYLYYCNENKVNYSIF